MGQSKLFSKRYDSFGAFQRAVANYGVLQLSGGCLLPRLVSIDASRCVVQFEAVTRAHYACEDELPVIADALGLFHARFVAQPDLLANVPPFAAKRRQHLDRLLRAGVERNLLTIATLGSVFENLRNQDIVIYKDGNVRNFLIKNDLVYFVDFDSVTRAPIGYDLAKLLVSFAMTEGGYKQRTASEILRRYTAAMNAATSGQAVCSEGRFAMFLEMHDCFTRKYVGQHDYRTSWPMARQRAEYDAARQWLAAVSAAEAGFGAG